jgi:cytochrome c553
MKISTLAAVFTAALASPAFAADVAKPEKATTCAACHGEIGVSQSGMYPTIAGQYTNYIEQALHAYKSGARKNAIMGAQAANLTDEDIKQLAAWFNAQQTPLYTPSVHGENKH